MRSAVLLLVAACVLPGQVAPPTIEYSEAKKVWMLHTDSSAMAIGVNQRGELQNLYWGYPLWRIEDFPAANGGRDLSSFDPAQSLINEEYPGWGGARYLEPSVKITRADGGRELVLHYASHSVERETLKVVLKDIKDDIFVTLSYKVYPHEGIIQKSAQLENRSQQAITVESMQAGTWYVPHGEGYRLSYVSGKWAGEDQLTRERIDTGTRILESRKGHTSHSFNPWFAIDEGSATEETGRVWFGALGWSGNWRIAVEQTPYGQVRVTGGLNPFDFAYVLKPVRIAGIPSTAGLQIRGSAACRAACTGSS